MALLCFISHVMKIFSCRSCA